MARLLTWARRALAPRAILVLVAVYLVVLPLALLAGGVDSRAEEAAGWAHQTERMATDILALQEGVANQSAGLDGYVLTADGRFLPDYDLGRRQAATAWSALAADAAGSTLEQGLPQVKATLDAWQVWAALRWLATETSRQPE